MMSIDQITAAIGRAEYLGDVDALPALHLLLEAAQPKCPVRAAYDAIGTEWASLTTIRATLTRQGLTRDQQDAALTQASRTGAILIPEGNQKSLTTADWDAALTLGRSPRHLIAYGV